MAAAVGASRGAPQSQQTQEQQQPRVTQHPQVGGGPGNFSSIQQARQASVNELGQRSLSPADGSSRRRLPSATNDSREDARRRIQNLSHSLDQRPRNENTFRLLGPISGPEFCVVWLRKVPASG